MGLIIGKKIKELMKGYPTVSDKYNVAGATLTGENPVEFGSLVKLSNINGYFEAIEAGDVTEDTFEKLGGFVLATNVKLNELWPEGNVRVNPGEAFNLLVNGFMAIGLASTAVKTDVVPNAKVYVTANGEITTVSDDAAVKDSEDYAIELPNVVFTGVIENQGTEERPAYVAEIYVK